MRNFVGNVYDLNQNDADGIYELENKRIKYGKIVTSN